MFVFPRQNVIGLFIYLCIQVHVEFLESGDKIKIEGPPDEVEKAREALEAQAKELIATTAFVDLKVDAKYHKHIIGKGGSTGTLSYGNMLHFA